MNPLPESSSPPAYLPPLPAGTVYGGQLKDYGDSVICYAFDGRWSNEPHCFQGMRNSDLPSSLWHVAIPFEAEQPSSPPVDARVACVDGGASPTTNKACPEPTSKLDDHGRGGFVFETGKFYGDRSGRRRGPVTVHHSFISVEDEHGYETFDLDGSWIRSGDDHRYDLIAPWIDWKAECEKAHESIREFMAACAPGVEGGLVGMATQDGRIAFYQRINPVMRKAELLLASLKGEGAGA